MTVRELTPEEAAKYTFPTGPRDATDEEIKAYFDARWRNLNEPSREAVMRRLQSQQSMRDVQAGAQLPKNPLLEGSFSQNSLLQAAAAHNVDIGTGLQDAKLRLGTNLAANQEYAAEYLKQNGLDAKVIPNVGTVYMNEDTGLWTSIEDFGITGYDVVDSANEILEFGGEVIGGVYGALKAGFLGTIGGGSAGAFGGEWARHGAAKAMGVPEPTNIQQRAQEKTLMAALFGALGEVGMGVAQFFRGFFNPRLAAYDPARLRYILDTEEAQSRKQLQDNINKKLEELGRDERLYLTPGQLSGDLDQLGREGDALSSKWGTNLETRHLENKSALEAYLDAITPLPDSVAARANAHADGAVSERVLDVVQEKHRRDVELLLQNITEAEARGQMFIAANFDYMTDDAIGGALQKQLQTARGVMKNYENLRWGQARRAYGYDPDTATSRYKIPWSRELARNIQELNAQSRTSLFASDAAGKEALTGRLLPNQDVFMVDPSGQVVASFRVGQDIDLDAAVRALQHLGRLKRAKLNGEVATDPAGRDIIGMHKTLKNAIESHMDNLAAAGDMKAGEAIHALRDAWSITERRARLFDTGIVGELLERQGGRYVVRQPQAVSLFLRSADREALREVYDIVSGYSIHGLQEFRRLIYAMYRREVAPNGTPVLTLHDDFMANHGKLIEEFFPQSAERIKGEFGEFGRHILKQQRELALLEDRINRVTGNKLVKTIKLPDGSTEVVTTISADDLTEKVMRGYFEFGDTSAIMRILREDGRQFGGRALADQWKRMVGDRIRNYVLSGRGPALSVSNLYYILKRERRLTPIFGGKYIHNLKNLKELLLQWEKKSAVSGHGNFLGELMEAWTRPVARPLSRLGLVRTAVMRTRRAAAGRAAADIVADPEKLAIFMQLQALKPESRHFANLLAQLGITHLNDLPEMPPEPIGLPLNTRE